MLIYERSQLGFPAATHPQEVYMKTHHICLGLSLEIIHGILRNRPQQLVRGCRPRPQESWIIVPPFALSGPSSAGEPIHDSVDAELFATGRRKNALAFRHSRIFVGLVDHRHRIRQSCPSRAYPGIRRAPSGPRRAPQDPARLLLFVLRNGCHWIYSNVRDAGGRCPGALSSSPARARCR